jgi:hypothetical protein
VSEAAVVSEAADCPICSAPSALDSCDEVDIGVGVMRGNELWDCPTHGRWAAKQFYSAEELRRRSHSFLFLDGEFRLFRPFRPAPIAKGGAK